MKIERGFTMESSRDFRRPPGFVLIEDHDYPYRSVWLSRATMQVLTQCEGDLTMETCESDEEMRAHLDRLRTFYRGLEEDRVPVRWGGQREEEVAA